MSSENADAKNDSPAAALPPECLKGTPLRCAGKPLFRIRQNLT
nr:MAG TPA: hypothetical protein [Caudoviricetes sp.]